MAAEPPGSPVTEAVRSLEVRWIFPGQLETAVAQWFGRFTAATESRQDTYLLGPQLPGLSVKIRGGGPLEVKVLLENTGILEVTGRARGRMQSWQKWSFSHSEPSHATREAASWRQVHKRRRIGWFSQGSEKILARSPARGGQPGCAVELTEVLAGGEAWWSLGFEASGPLDLHRGVLEATAALVFAETLPASVELGMGESRSYAEWLGQQPGL